MPGAPKPGRSAADCVPLRGASTSAAVAWKAAAPAQAAPRTRSRVEAAVATGGPSREAKKMMDHEAIRRHEEEKRLQKEVVDLLADKLASMPGRVVAAPKRDSTRDMGEIGKILAGAFYQRRPDAGVRNAHAHRNVQLLTSAVCTRVYLRTHPHTHARARRSINFPCTSAF